MSLLARLRSRMGRERQYSCAQVLQEFGERAHVWGGEGGQRTGALCHAVVGQSLVIRATWICKACVEAIRYGTKRWSISYGSTGMMHMYCFGSRWLLPRCAVLAASPAPTMGDHPTVPYGKFYSRIGRRFATFSGWAIYSHCVTRGCQQSRKSRLRDGMMSADSQHEQGRAPGQSARQYG